MPSSIEGRPAYRRSHRWINPLIADPRPWDQIAPIADRGGGKRGDGRKEALSPRAHPGRRGSWPSPQETGGN
eukprot:5776040-Alexandrium_andersonii.AAC.1